MATTTEPVVELRAVPGVQLYVPAPPLAVRVEFCAGQMLAGFALTGKGGEAEKVRVVVLIKGIPGQVFMSV